MSTLRGVGARIAERLQVLGIVTIQDALFHLPRRYLARTRVRPIGGLVSGEDALVQGSIELAQVQFGKRRSLLCRISDGTGSLTLRFFHFSKAQQNNLESLSKAFIDYFEDPKYLEYAKNKFGQGTVDNIEKMLQHKLKRKLLGD